MTPADQGGLLITVPASLRNALLPLFAQISADSRWLLSSSLDGSLRVWDVPVARCLQASQTCWSMAHC